MKLKTFDDDLKEQLKDPIFKAGFKAWEKALDEEIFPRDKMIAKLKAENERLKFEYKLLCDQLLRKRNKAANQIGRGIHGPDETRGANL